MTKSKGIQPLLDRVRDLESQLEAQAELKDLVRVLEDQVKEQNDIFMSWFSDSRQINNRIRSDALKQASELEKVLLWLDNEAHKVSRPDPERSRILSTIKFLRNLVGKSWTDE